MKRATLVVIGLLLVTVVILTIHDKGPTSRADSKSEQESVEEIIVTRDNSAFPPSCRPHEVARFLIGFFDAVNRGDQNQLPTFFRSDFDFFAVAEGDPRNGGRGFFFYDPQNSSLRFFEGPPQAVQVRSRDDLLPYFVERHKQGERLRLVTVDLAYEAQRDLAQIAFVVVRYADDLPTGLGGPDRIAEGKGAISCKNQTIVAWNMSMNEKPLGPLRLSCPEPPNGTPLNTVVACSRD